MNINYSASDAFFALPGVKRKDPKEEAANPRRPMLGFLPNRIRNHIIAMAGEFVGTFLFLFFAFAATQVANQASGDADTSSSSLSQAPDAGTLVYISLAFGFSLAVNAWVFFRISGGLFNPAVTLGMALIGAVGWTRAGLVFISQILGAIAASGVVDGLFPSAFDVKTSLGGGTSVVQGLFIEMFLTAELVFTIFMLAAEKHKGTFLAPIGIGLALFIAEMAGVYYTGGSLNPARSFGPCVVLGSFDSYHWIYWLGPCLGSVLAVCFYRFVKALEYETANPGQDFNEKEAEVFQFDEDTADTAEDVMRPTVAVGVDYIADSQGIRKVSTSEAEAKPRPSTGAGSGGRSSNAAAKGRYDGTEDGRRQSSMTAVDRRRSASDGGNHAPAGTYLPRDRYRAGPDAENGELGGNYRVSGL